jgi:hypothetical protein
VYLTWLLSNIACVVESPFPQDLRTYNNIIKVMVAPCNKVGNFLYTKSASVREYQFRGRRDYGRP